MEKINFTGMTGAQAFRAIDANGGVNDDEISVNMEAWARVSFFNQFNDAQLIAAVKKFGNVSASYAATLAGHLQSCIEFDPELIGEAAEQLMLQDREVKCMGEKIKALEAELEAVGAGGVQSLRKVEKKIPEKARSISDDMMDVVDRLGGEWADVDPRAWAHLIVYAPKPAAQPVNQQMLEALRKIVSMDDAQRLTQGDIERGRAAIAQAEAQQAARHD